MDFRFSAFRQNVKQPFLRNSGQVRFEYGSFFLVARIVPLSFLDHTSKLRVLIIAIGHWPEIAKIRDEPRKMTPTSQTEFVGVAQGVLVIFDENA